MLRWSYGHHRKIRARRDAIVLANRPAHRHQDRHLMTAPACQFQSLTHLRRRSSTRRGELRSNIEWPSQITQTSPPLKRATRHSSTEPQSTNAPRRLATTRAHHPPRPNPHSPGRTTNVSLPAVSSLGGFRTPAAIPLGSALITAGIRNPSQTRKSSQ